MTDLLPILLLFGVMYFLLVRPQQRRVRAQRALVETLAVGDEVVTIGGVLGHVVGLDDDSAEVQTTPGTVIRFRRTAISGKVAPIGAAGLEAADPPAASAGTPATDSPAGDAPEDDR